MRGVGRQKEEGSFDVALGPTWRFCQRDATSVTWRGGRGGGCPFLQTDGRTRTSAHGPFQGKHTYAYVR